MNPLRNGRGGRGDNLFFPDKTLDRHVLTDRRPYLKRTGIICSHCHKEIRGKFYNIGNKFFDQYCWSLRYILEAQELEVERVQELRRHMDISE